MKLNFSKQEILALEATCQSELDAGRLAEKLKAKKSFVSRILRRLEEKGLIMVEKTGTYKIIRLSPASHAQNFKKLFEARRNAKIENWLAGKVISVLIVMAYAKSGVDMGLIADESGCSKPTIYKILKKLYGAGVANKEGGLAQTRDMLVLDFASSYADNIQLMLQKPVRGINVSIRIRKHIVLRTDAKKIPAFFSLTGASLLAKKYGLEANLASYDDYYFNLDEIKREIGMEEAFAHAILITTLQFRQDMPVLAIFFARNRRRFDMGKLGGYAKKYRVETEVEELRRTVEYHNKMEELK